VWVVERIGDILFGPHFPAIVSLRRQQKINFSRHPACSSPEILIESATVGRCGRVVEHWISAGPPRPKGAAFHLWGVRGCREKPSCFGLSRQTGKTSAFSFCEGSIPADRQVNAARGQLRPVDIASSKVAVAEVEKLRGFSGPAWRR